MKPPRPTDTPSPGSPEEDFAHDLSDPELWDLLGKADRPTPISPFFARNVLREVRLAEARKMESGVAGFLRSLIARWRMVAGGATVTAALALAATLALHAPHHSAAPGTAQVTSTAAYDAEIITQLDELLDDDSIWLDSTVSAY